MNCTTVATGIETKKERIGKKKREKKKKKKKNSHAFFHATVLMNDPLAVKVKITLNRPTWTQIGLVQEQEIDGGNATQI